MDGFPYPTTLPVILVHMAADTEPGLVACAPMSMPIYSSDVYTTTPRMICPACHAIMMGNGVGEKVTAAYEQLRELVARR